MQDILVFAGSARTNAFSKKLAKSAALSIRRRTPIRARATLIDLADFDAPLFNADLEFLQGVPETMQAIKAMVRSHDGLLIVTPEYNGFIPPLLVNLFSWTSRPEPHEPPGLVYQGKPVALAASSPGRLGGIRVIPRLRDAASELGMIPVPGFVTIPNAETAFAADGTLADETMAHDMEALVNRLLTLCVKIKEKRGKRISGGEPVPDQNDKADQNDKTGQNDKTDQNDKTGQTGKQAASRVG
jgi:NAD(P)H-dependent FMN reductase